MNIIQKLSDASTWQQFLEYKISAGNLPASELKKLSSFISGEEYLPLVGMLASGTFPVIPVRKEINKKATSKKRIVYSFPEPEVYILKLIAFLLHDYDRLFSNNLYSFRKDTGVKNAISLLSSCSTLSCCYSFKADIHNYFNSINPEKMLEMLKEALPEEPELTVFLERLLLNETVYPAKQDSPSSAPVTDSSKGIMAGLPTAAFMANLYLSEMDRWFSENGYLYMRYSDDIIFFAQDREKLEKAKDYFFSAVKAKGLTINPEKTCETSPGEEISFLGFTVKNGITDISDIARDKLKAKLRRKARALNRWKRKKKAEEDRTLKAFFREVNKKLYENPIKNELTWCRWYFPLISTDASLKELDEYIRSMARYSVTGAHKKTNYRIRHEKLKECGYRSLVHEYYRDKIL